MQKLGLEGVGASLLDGDYKGFRLTRQRVEISRVFEKVPQAGVTIATAGVSAARDTLVVVIAAGSSRRGAAMVG